MENRRSQGRGIRCIDRRLLPTYTIACCPAAGSLYVLHRVTYQSHFNCSRSTLFKHV